MLLTTAFAVALTASSVGNEYLRLDQHLKSLTTAGVPKELEPELQSARDALNRGASANGTEYRLYRLRDAFVTVERIRYVVDHSKEDLQQLWNSEKPRFEKHATDRGTALERALEQSSATRAERYFQASIQYAKATNALNGLFYLADASANLAFRDFVRSLADRGAAERVPSSRQLASTLDALDSATLQFFSTRVTTPEAIPVSARLKEARELWSAGRNEGAMLLAIEAGLVLADRGGSVATTEGATAPAGSMSSLLAEWCANELQPDRKKNREKAVAFYAGLFSAKQTAGKAKPQIVVTLVRWPYT